MTLEDLDWRQRCILRDVNGPIAAIYNKRRIGPIHRLKVAGLVDYTIERMPGRSPRHDWHKVTVRILPEGRKLFWRKAA